ncbi:unnamed protein product, partial [Ectocarpus sp. 4 AP-2014]
MPYLHAYVCFVKYYRLVSTALPDRPIEKSLQWRCRVRWLPPTGRSQTRLFDRVQPPDLFKSRYMRKKPTTRQSDFSFSKIQKTAGTFYLTRYLVSVDHAEVIGKL